jgi:serine/threonine protein kinase
MPQCGIADFPAWVLDMLKGNGSSAVSEAGSREDAQGRALSAPGFLRCELVYEGRRNFIYRAWRDAGTCAIVKTPAADPLGPYEIARIQYEYAVLSVLEIPGVPRPLSLEHQGRRPLLVLHDAGPCNLLQALDGKPYPLGQFLEAAAALTRVVGAVHSRGFVHRDICPENIVCADGGPADLTLVDFDRVMPLAHADTSGMPGEQFTGTLPYSSPEQSGSSGHAVDYRTDYYSLGATFYEMLTGNPPFAAADEAEYAGGPLTGRAIAPHERNREVPPRLSEIALRLLERSPHERYQSAEEILEALASVTSSAART